MALILQIVIFVLILSFLVIIHELGHLFAAKWAKVKVEEFGLGYPPRAFKLFTWGKVLFSLNWIPIGGFVKMIGEDGPDQVAVASGKSSKADEEDDGLAPFYKRSALKRLVIILAGVTVNFVFGILAFMVIFSFQGIPTLLSDSALPRIGYIAPGSPAELAGLEVDSNILSLSFEENKLLAKSDSEVIEFINNHKGKTLVIETSGKCNGEACPENILSYEVVLRTDDQIPEGEGSLGIGFADYYFHFYPWYEMPWRSLWFGLTQALMMSVMIVLALGNIFVSLLGGSMPQDVAGPVGIIDQASSVGLFSQGWLAILNFMAMISINLAVVNLLPIPALDGGRALFIILEKLFGKKVINKIESYANYFGMGFLLFLIVLITLADIGRIIMR